jgi:predicted DNA-binding protein
MARISVKSTYSLDVDTIRRLERVAARWSVSKSEVLRRAIEAVDRDEMAGTPLPLEALQQLQNTLKLTPRQAVNWSREIRRERVKGSARREWRSQ